MKIFFTLKPALSETPHPKEDFFAISKKYPIFVVADGVTLNFDDENYYPKESGAGEVAKIFCETVICETEKRYENFAENNLREIFELGNKAVGEYNNSKGLAKGTVNYWDKDLFSATTSFVLLKDGKAYWWSLCDSGVAQFNKKGKELFISPNSWDILDKFISKKFGNITEKEKIIILHRDFRNNLTGNGYGVVTGEEAAKLYLNTGVLEVSAGDVIFVYTDGYEHHIELKDFVKIFTSWPKDIEKSFESLDSKIGKENPSKYARERTIIAVSI